MIYTMSEVAAATSADGAQAFFGFMGVTCALVFASKLIRIRLKFIFI